MIHQLLKYINTLNSNITVVYRINKTLPYLPKGFYYSKFYGGIPAFFIIIRAINNYYTGILLLNENKDYIELNDICVDTPKLYDGTVIFGYYNNNIFYAYDPLIVAGTKYINEDIIKIYNETNKLLENISIIKYVEIYDTTLCTLKFSKNIMLRTQTYNSSVTKFIVACVKNVSAFNEHFILNKIYTLKLKKTENPDIYDIYDLNDRPLNKIAYIKTINESMKLKKIFNSRDEYICKIKIIKLNNEIKLWPQIKNNDI